MTIVNFIVTSPMILISSISNHTFIEMASESIQVSSIIASPDKEIKKEVYVPEWAERKAEIHAGNFMFNREKQVEYLASIMDRKPVVVAPYDAELFGHWWFEGPLWLDSLIRKIASKQKTIRLITLSEYLEGYPINQISQPCPSSWGFKGFNEVWLNEKNDWIYPHLHAAASRMEKLAARHSRDKRARTASPQSSWP